ncbi:GSCOCG00001193001-RA-CDS [Cotesia congregata]|nr:GSCOCG00001193001-RA-CDS [Cotesia congregata]
MQNWGQWQVPPAGTAAGPMPQPPAAPGYPATGTDPMATMQAYMQYYNQPAPSGYTTEQWAAAQQQNWAQWQQWQQQYQQWQAQYGAKYQESMKQMSSMTSGLQPPPLPKEDFSTKPPLPPENMNQNLGMPPPTQNNFPFAFKPNVNPPLPPGQPPPPPENPPPSDNDLTGIKRSANDHLNTSSAKKTKSEDDELTDAERTFDAQFKQWEEQFNKWKLQNADHPDKAQYKQYEAKWTSWREKLIERREQMRKKREAQKAKVEAEKKKTLPGGDKLLNILSNTENQGLINNLLGIGKTLGLSGKEASSVSTSQPASASVTASLPVQAPVQPTIPVMSTTMTPEASQQAWAAQQWAQYSMAAMTVPSYTSYPPPVIPPPAPLVAPSSLGYQPMAPPPNPLGNFSQPPPGFPSNNFSQPSSGGSSGNQNAPFKPDDNSNAPFRNDQYNNNNKNNNNNNNNNNSNNNNNNQSYNDRFGSNDSNNRQGQDSMGQFRSNDSFNRDSGPNRFNQDDRSNFSGDRFRRDGQSGRDFGFDNRSNDYRSGDSFGSKDRSNDRNFGDDRFSRDDGNSRDNNRFGGANRDSFNSSSDRGSGSNNREQMDSEDRFGNNQFNDDRFGSDRFNSGSDRRDNFGNSNNRNQGRNSRFDQTPEMSPELKKLMEKRRVAMDIFKPSGTFLGADKSDTNFGSLSESFKKITGDSPFLPRNRSSDFGRNSFSDNNKGSFSDSFNKGSGSFVSNNDSDNRFRDDFRSRGSDFNQRGSDDFNNRFDNTGPRGSNDFGPRGRDFGPRGSDSDFGYSTMTEDQSTMKENQTPSEEKQLSAVNEKENKSEPVISPSNLPPMDIPPWMDSQMIQNRSDDKDHGTVESFSVPEKSNEANNSETKTEVDKNQAARIVEPEKKLDVLPFMGENDPKPEDLNMEPPPELPNLGSRKPNTFDSKRSDSFGPRNSDRFGPRGPDGFGPQGSDSFGFKRPDPFGLKGPAPFGRQETDSFEQKGPEPFGPRGSDSFGPRGSDSFGPKGNDSFGPREKDSFGPRGSDSFGPKGNDSFGPRGNDSFGPRGNDLFGPRGNDSFGPRGNDSFGPRGNDSFGPRGNDSFGPRGNDSFGPRGNDSFGPRGNDSFGPKGPDSFGPRGSDMFGPRENDSFGPRGPDSFGPRGFDSFGPKTGFDSFGSSGPGPFGPRGPDSFGPRGPDSFGPRGPDSFGSRFGSDMFGPRGPAPFEQRRTESLDSRGSEGSSFRNLDLFGPKGPDPFGPRDQSDNRFSSSFGPSMNNQRGSSLLGGPGGLNDDPFSARNPNDPFLGPRGPDDSDFRPGNSGPSFSSRTFSDLQFITPSSEKPAPLRGLNEKTFGPNQAADDPPKIPSLLSGGSNDMQPGFNKPPMDMDNSFSRRMGNQPGVRRDGPMHPSFCIEKQFNYNHGDGAPNEVFKEYKPSKVTDYGHIRRPSNQDYVTPVHCFDYSHGRLKPVVPDHEIYPRLEFQYWQENEHNLKEYNDSFSAYKNRLIRSKMANKRNRREPSPVWKREERKRFSDHYSSWDREDNRRDRDRDRDRERDRDNRGKDHRDDKRVDNWEDRRGESREDRRRNNRDEKRSDRGKRDSFSSGHHSGYSKDSKDYKDNKDSKDHKETRDKKERQPSWEIEIEKLSEETARKNASEEKAREKLNRNQKDSNTEIKKDEERSKGNVSRQENSLNNIADASNQDSRYDYLYVTNIEPKSPPRTMELAKTSNLTIIDDLLFPPGRQNRPPKIAIILRGPPGSGKSFVAKLIKDKELEQAGSAPRILSLDDYFLTEKEIESTDDNGKKIINKYEEGMESSYLTSLVKAFKKNIVDGFFNFIILDSINEKISDYEEMWSFAKSKGFRVYICEMDMDVQICLKRNVHNRTEDEINRIIDYFEPTPNYHQKLDVSSLLQDEAIEQVTYSNNLLDSYTVQMEEVTPLTDKKSTDSNEDSQDSQEGQNPLGVSKWEKMEAEDKLDRLDGLAKRKNDSKPQTMEDFLQVPDYYDSEDSSGKKRVRWADLEERKQQEKLRAVGFVVGQTNWNRMMDPTMGSSALTRTKFYDSKLQHLHN